MKEASTHNASRKFSYWLKWMLIPVVLFIGLEFYSFLTGMRNSFQLNAQIKGAKQNDTLFMGSSHTAYAICDTFEGVHNLGSYNEPFLFTLKKIELLNPKVVVLSVNIQNVQYNYEKIFDKGILSIPQNKYLMRHLSKAEKSDVYALMDFETAALYHTRKILPFVGSKLKGEENDWLFGGWRDAGNRSELDSFRIAKRMEEEFIRTHYQPSEFQWKYLQRIVEHCRTRKVQLIFLSTPLYKPFRQQIAESEFAVFNSRLAALCMKDSIQRLDFTELDLPANHFLDSDHLNGVGAPVFTERVLKEIRRENK